MFLLGALFGSLSARFPWGARSSGRGQSLQTLQLAVFFRLLEYHLAAPYFLPPMAKVPIDEAAEPLSIKA
jgi:hypothetical protein